MRGHHILFISSWYPHRGQPTHGIFNRAFAEAVALRSRVSVLHVAPDHQLRVDRQEEITDDGAIFTTIVYYRPRSGASFSERLRQYARRRAAYLQGFDTILKARGRPDLIHLNVVYPAGQGALLLSRRHRLPLVVNECWTGYDPADGRYRGAFLKWFTRNVISRARAILPVSAHLEQLMLQHGLRGKYRVVPNVINTNVFTPGTANDERTRFVHVSALDEAQKNVSGILAAFCEALKQEPRLELVIIGNGIEAQALRKKAATMSPRGGISFKGALAPAEVASELRQSHALVMFSNYETFCVAVPEALACGVPVITSDAGGIMSYFSDKYGYVVPRGDQAALAAAMVAVARRSKHFDPLVLRAFVEADFSPEVVCERLHEVYDAVIRKA